MTTACQEAFVIACLYEVVEGRISARDASTIINRERVEADVEKLQKHIDTQRKAMRGSESLRKFIKRERTTMFERWGIADGSGLLVRDNFGRFVVSATTETPGQGGDDADAGGAVCGDETRCLGASTGGGFDDVMTDMEAMP